jgi:uncharacterized Fe-S center protein
MRKAFIHQVAIPIALEYLDNANNEESYFKTFEEIINTKFLNKELVNYFENTTPNAEYKTCLEHAEKIGIGNRAYELIVMK